jgi:hypothetical protein
MVSGSRLTMRIWCVLGSLMTVLPFWRTRLRRMVSNPAGRSMCVPSRDRAARRVVRR